MLWWVRLLLIALNWVVFQIGSGLIAHHLPVSIFDRETKASRVHAFEAESRFYRRYFLIQRWKHLLPEAGALFAGGFAKNSVPPCALRDEEFLERFVAETRRAELTHWLPILLSATFFLWNPLEIAVWMPVYAMITNVPFIMVQRANRPRLQRLAEKRGAGGADRTAG